MPSHCPNLKGSSINTGKEKSLVTIKCTIVGRWGCKWTTAQNVTQVECIGKPQPSLTIHRLQWWCGSRRLTQWHEPVFQSHTDGWEKCRLQWWHPGSNTDKMKSDVLVVLQASSVYLGGWGGGGLVGSDEPLPPPTDGEGPRKWTTFL